MGNPMIRWPINLVGKRKTWEYVCFCVYILPHVKFIHEIVRISRLGLFHEVVHHHIFFFIDGLVYNPVLGIRRDFFDRDYLAESLEISE